MRSPGVGTFAASGQAFAATGQTFAATARRCAVIGPDAGEDRGLPTRAR
ncbi:hypothetical protein [Streptomyces sp. MB09-02B]|nr:hypothetical protein [Streptomyces sp. MB09-02B]MDX3645684.1 hypothetical protein [Streptomyces sp. MB09-02B]